MTIQRQPYTALITGANNGIGLALTRKLLEQGWEIIALIRSPFPEKDDGLNELIRQRKLRLYKADLADFISLRKALDEIKSKEETIDVLFNNAGGSFPELVMSKQGRELHYELQTVAPYIIYRELNGRLQGSRIKTVIHTSSAAAMLVKQFNPLTLAKPLTFRKLFGPYASSKLALSLWTREAARTAGQDGIRMLSVDPGPNNTLRSGKHSGLPVYIKPLMKFFFPHPDSGATRLYEAAVNSGGYPAGAFIVKGRPLDLKFAEQGAAVLKLVDDIYEQEFTRLETGSH